MYLGFLILFSGGRVPGEREDNGEDFSVSVLHRLPYLYFRGTHFSLRKLQFGPSFMNFLSI
jgi:hypothetical protein